MHLKHCREAFWQRIGAPDFALDVIHVQWRDLGVLKRQESTKLYVPLGDHRSRESFADRVSQSRYRLIQRIKPSYLLQQCVNRCFLNYAANYMHYRRLFARKTRARART